MRMMRCMRRWMIKGGGKFGKMRKTWDVIADKILIQIQIPWLRRPPTVCRQIPAKYFSAFINITKLRNQDNLTLSSCHFTAPMIFSKENRTWPSLCGWIWQLDCVSLGHWPQGTTPGILSCWHRFSYTAMPTVHWSFKTGCTSEQCKAKSRECERVSLSVCAVFLQLDCAVLCLCLFPSSHLSHDGARVRVPANKSSRQFSTHSLFPPSLFSDHPWIYQWRKCVFDKDHLWVEVYILFHKLALKTKISWSETFAARPVSNACRRVAGSGLCGKS